MGNPGEKCHRAAVPSTQAAMIVDGVLYVFPRPAPKAWVTPTCGSDTERVNEGG